MADPHPERASAQRDDKRSFLQKLVEFINPGPDSRDELIETLADAEDNDVIGAESRVMLEGVLRMADMTAGDVMVAAPRMDLLDIDAPLDALVNQVIDTAHSRFPVFEGDKENIIGILLAKDLLKLQRSPGLNIRALLRPATFVPETKRVSDLLKEFQRKQVQLAIVVDEYGGTAGLATLEDLLEEIVGEIRDEYDDESDAILDEGNGSFLVSGKVDVDEVAQRLKVQIEREGFETVGGYLLSHIGRVPLIGERFDIDSLRVEVLDAERRRINKVRISKSEGVEAASDT